MNPGKEAAKPLEQIGPKLLEWGMPQEVFRLLVEEEASRTGMPSPAKVLPLQQPPAA